MVFDAKKREELFGKGMIIHKSCGFNAADDEEVHRKDS